MGTLAVQQDHTYITFGLCMEIEIRIFNTFMIAHVENLFKILSQHVLIAPSFLKQINEND